MQRVSFTRVQPGQSLLDVARQMGVGGINSWGAWPLKKYQLPAKPYRYAFRLRGLRSGVDDPASIGP